MEKVVEPTCQQDNRECDTMDTPHCSQRSVSHTEQAPRYPQRERRKPTRFTINAEKRTHYDEEPLTAQALKGDDAFNWRTAMNKEVDTLEAMQCWDIVKRPENEKVLHTKFVLKRKQEESGAKKKYKVRLVICENKETENEADCFFSVSDFTVIKSFIVFGNTTQMIRATRGFLKRVYKQEIRAPRLCGLIQVPIRRQYTGKSRDVITDKFIWIA